jgi:hypothetical protein
VPCIRSRQRRTGHLPREGVQPGVPPDDVFAQPWHEAVLKALPDLIVQLRADADVRDGYEFQQESIGHDGTVTSYCPLLS